jgi:hypothetical protein
MWKKNSKAVHHILLIIAYKMKGVDLISFSMPKRRSSLLNKNAVPVLAILHGTHEISLHTVQAMLGQIEAYCSAWAPIYLGPSTLYTALQDHGHHAMYKAFLESSSTSQADIISHVRG